MSDGSIEQEIRRAAIKRWIITAIAAVIAIVIIAVAIYYAYYLDALNKQTDIRLDGVAASCVVTAAMTLSNFILFFVIYSLGGYHNSILKIVKIVLKIAACGLIAVMFGLSVLAIAGDSEKMVAELGIWVIGVATMPILGETIVLLAFYWCKRLRTPPRGVDAMDYQAEYATRVSRAHAFEKMLVGVPVVGFVIGYFVGILCAQLGKSVHFIFCAWVIVIVCALSYLVSILIFGKAFRYGSRAGGKKSGGKSSHHSYGNSGASVATAAAKKVDEGHTAGKKLLASELCAYGDSKFVPVSWDLPNSVDNVRWTGALQVSNKDWCFTSECIALRGTLSCDIKREDLNPAGSAQEVLDSTISNIKDKARELISELYLQYSNYKSNYKIDCGGIKVNYKIV